MLLEPCLLFNNGSATPSWSDVGIPPKCITFGGGGGGKLSKDRSGNKRYT